MNKKVQLLIILVIAVLFIVGGSYAYNYLSEDYTDKNLLPESDGNTLSITKTNTAPDFTVIDMNGNSVSLSEQFGKPVLINFWATWCGPCLSEMPHFEEMYKKYGDEVVFMMVNLTDGSRDTVSSVKKFIEDNGYTFPVYFDSEYSGATAYSVRSIPVTYGIDKNGNVIKSYIGSLKVNSLEGIIEVIK